MASENKSCRESISKRLARFIHDLMYKDLPKEIQDLAKTRILDVVSCALAGRDLPHSRTALEIVKESSGTCTVIGSGRKVAMPDAAMANSVLAHSILREDTAFSGHPGTMMVPVALAVGEQERASGRDTLTAIVLGYEIMARLSRAVYPMIVSGFRPGPIMGTSGAGATAGKLMKLGVEELTHALGYAASLTPGVPNEGWWGGKMEPVFEAGVCARIGILSATLARGGATAAPLVFEGKHGFLRCWSGTVDRASLITKSLGMTFAISETVIKPYPACNINQLPIQVALRLAKAGLKACEIVRVVEKTRVGGTSYAGSDFAGPFTSQFQAQMSMQFCAAAALLGRPVKSSDFFAEQFADPEVAELASKVELVCEEGRTNPRFEVYTRDGRVLTAEEECVDQGPRTPSLENMESKFTELAAKALGEERARQILTLVMDLDKMEDIRELTRIF